MSVFSDTLTSLMSKQDMNDETLADLVNVSRTTVTRWRTGIRSPKMEKLPEIAKIFNVDPKVFVGEIDLPQSNIVSIYEKLDKLRQQKVYDFASDQLAEQNNPHKNNIAKFPSRTDDEQTDYDIYSDIKIYGAASAGPGEVLMDEHTETVTYHGFVPKHDYALVVNGNSMEPLFADQQVIFVDKTEEAYNGQIVIAYLNGNAYVKKLWISSDKCELVSLNPDYAPIEITENDDFCIDGVVVL